MNSEFLKQAYAAGVELAVKEAGMLSHVSRGMDEDNKDAYLGALIGAPMVGVPAAMAGASLGASNLDRAYENWIQEPLTKGDIDPNDAKIQHYLRKSVQGGEAFRDVNHGRYIGRPRSLLGLLGLGAGAGAGWGIGKLLTED